MRQLCNFENNSAVAIISMFGFPDVSSTSLYKLFMSSSEHDVMLLVHIHALALVCSALLCREQIMLLWSWCCLPSLYNISISSLWESL